MLALTHAFCFNAYSIMAVTDESYFDWPVLPEAPSSLNVSSTGNIAKLDWLVHGGSPTGIVVERRIDGADSTKKTWSRVAKLPPTAIEYSDSSLKNGERFATGCAQSMAMASLPTPTSCGEYFQPDLNRE
jgi:hypothetical protein